MPIRKVFCLFLCLCVLLWMFPAKAQDKETLDAQLGKVFKNFKTVGGAVVVARGGQIVYERYYGNATQKGPVKETESCKKFVYSPLKRIPVKQLNIEGAVGAEEMYVEISEEELAAKQAAAAKADAAERAHEQAQAKAAIERAAQEAKEIAAAPLPVLPAVPSLLPQPSPWLPPQPLP